jgi:quinoprotein glucose dehydrogenase
MTRLRKFIISAAIFSVAAGATLYLMRKRVRSALSLGGRIHVAQGFTSEVFASHPLLADPVAFAIDERNRLYVAETNRLDAGATDIRQHMAWLDEDLASMSVEARVQLIKRHEGPRLAEYTKQTDRIRLLWDSDGNGKADRSTIFADGFNEIQDGIGSGLLVRHGNVYYTNVPNLWLLRGESKAGRAESRTALLSGFGIRIGFLGHDLHGLRMGPDGKLYFTMGDRGLHVVTKSGGVEQTISNREDGAVLRCNLDGTGLEIVARGLRNPQELAFDA